MKMITKGGEPSASNGGQPEYMFGGAVTGTPSRLEENRD